MKVKGKLVIDCEHCGKEYEFEEKNITFKKQEREGDDECYVWEYSHKCVKCGNPISIKCEVCITKDGQIKDKKLDVKGAKVKENSLEFMPE